MPQPAATALRFAFLVTPDHDCTPGRMRFGVGHPAEHRTPPTAARKQPPDKHFDRPPSQRNAPARQPGTRRLAHPSSIAANSPPNWQGGLTERDPLRRRGSRSRTSAAVKSFTGPPGRSVPRGGRKHRWGTFAGVSPEIHGQPRVSGRLRRTHIRCVRRRARDTTGGARVDMDLVVDLLIAYAVGDQARTGLQVGELSGRALDTVAGLVGDVVVAELGDDPAIDRLIQEARSGAAPSEATRTAARAVLETTARTDLSFRNALARAVAGRRGNLLGRSTTLSAGPPPPPWGRSSAAQPDRDQSWTG